MISFVMKGKRMVKKHLTFYLSEHAFVIGVLENDIFQLIDKVVFTSKAELHCKSEIQKLLDKNQINSDSFEEFSLAWFSSYSTLIPANLFSESTPEVFLKGTFFKEILHNDIDYNRLSELALVNVYEVPLWVKSFFVIRFPKIVIQHQQTIFLRGIFDGPTFKTSVHIQLYENHVQIIIVGHNELKFSNYFEFSSIEDIIYYVFFVLQQEKLTDQKINLQIADSVERDALLSETVINRLRNLKELTNYSTKIESYLELKYQKTCV